MTFHLAVAVALLLLRPHARAIGLIRESHLGVWVSPHPGRESRGGTGGGSRSPGGGLFRLWLDSGVCPPPQIHHQLWATINNGLNVHFHVRVPSVP